jgi:hypothetical protein
VETTKAFATHVGGVTVSPTGYTHKDGRQTLGTCKFVTRMWRRQLQFKTETAAALCHFHFFAHFQKIHQSNLVLTFGKVILSVERKHLYQNQGKGETKCK